ncbi:hypothetical protein [Undibacterium sp. YM2]|uniref:hypothetical protein n=1 Tax=Undibacterium sp. YM2 TaxID=2058625 RepID=UPI0013897B80|nr:hypothetical protein [Undibacterium sp. YM2]
MNDVMRSVCKANIFYALDRLQKHSDQYVIDQAEMIKALLTDLELSTASPNVEEEAPSRKIWDTDPTNYDTYKLLHQFGLSPTQLIDVTKCEGLHELRTIRMLRLTFDLSYMEAKAIFDGHVGS